MEGAVLYIKWCFLWTDFFIQLALYMLKHSSVSKCPLNCWKSFQYSTLNSSVRVGQLTQHCILHTLFLLIEVELNKIKFHNYLKRAILFWINRDTIKVADPNPGISVGSGSESWNQVRSGPGLKKWSDPDHDLVLKFGQIWIQSEHQGIYWPKW